MTNVLSPGLQPAMSFPNIGRCKIDGYTFAWQLEATGCNSCLYTSLASSTALFADPTITIAGKLLDMWRSISTISPYAPNLYYTLHTLAHMAVLQVHLRDVN